jgi:membrane protein involved in colicin uptake
MSTDESRSPSPTPSELKLQWRLTKKKEDRKKELAQKKRRADEEKKRAEEERAAKKAKMEKRKATDEAAQGADAPCKRVRIEAVDPIAGPSSATGTWETAKEPCNR